MNSASELPTPAKWRLALELVLVYVSLPALAASIFRGPGWLFPALWCGLGLAAIALLRDPSFERARLWRWSAFRQHGLPILLRFLALASLLGAGVALFRPDLLFSLIRARPELWLIVMFGYPLLSVFPQEVLFRTFFFHRYAALFPRPWQMIAASALIFGYAHIVFLNALAVVLTTLGGILFGLTYRRTKSTFLVCFEHALFGCFIFTIGIGRFFYSGAVR